MRSSDEIADMIIAEFMERKEAKGARNYFKCAGRSSKGVLVSRQNGSIYDVTKDYIIKAVEVVRIVPTIYEDGPSRLKPYINRWIYSPLWALLRLLSINEITR